MRAAMVGGGAYVAGKRMEQGREREAEQEARLESLEGQQAAPAAAVQPAGMSDATINQLKELGQLRDSGVLTDDEFQAQKQKLLGGT
jgi:hypothetical protein